MITAHFSARPVETLAANTQKLHDLYTLLLLDFHRKGTGEQLLKGSPPEALAEICGEL